ncbi:MAG: cytochrome c3 family protein [Nitrospirae bacterium]|nr:cytochrome c3 family protein [Magnetococcales bacterium]HAT50273.1 hypothetical protein [Alphaproteobacteria bacterium]
MKYSLQSSNYKETDYERPNPEWVCGRHHLGQPCRRGPDPHGGCQGHGACDPVQRGDRWFCTRPDIAGGPCSTGPLPDGGCGQPILPCVPLRSHRALLRRVSWKGVGVAIALLMVLLFGWWRLDFLNPGELSPPHAVIRKCSACHSAFDGGLPHWFLAAIGKTLPGKDSDLCLMCHPRVAQARWAHNMNPEILGAAAMKGITPPKDPTTRPRATASPSCSVCHREHTGGVKAPVIRDALLCNSCHQTTIAGFSTDHPNFQKASRKRGRSSIDFDHTAHFNRHFQGKLKEHAPTGCNGCHDYRPNNGLLASTDFTTACSACHVDQIRGDFKAGFKGFPVLSVPGLDTQAMATQGMDTGEWPEMADGELTLFMRLLLRDDPSFNDAWNRLQNRDLLNLETLSPEEKKALTAMVWSIKGFFKELLTDGHTAWAKRFYGQGELPAIGDVFGEINGGLGVDTLRTAVQGWFPNLEREWVLHNQGLPVPYPTNLAAASQTDPPKKEEKGLPAPGQGENLLTNEAEESLLDDGPKIQAPKMEEGLLDAQPEETTAVVTEKIAPPSPPMDDEAWTRGGGWYRAGYFLYYRPSGHNDPFLRSWVDLLSRLPDPAAQQLRTVLSDKNAPGVCEKCHRELLKHREEPMHGDGLDIRSLTRFSHKPHVNALRNNCQECHRMETTVPSSTSGDPIVSQTMGFTAITRESCVACHSRDKAGEDCLQCHNYHARPQ